MSTSPDQNPFAPPSARVADVASSGAELAGRGPRFFAALIDGLIQGVVYYLLAVTLLSSVLPNPTNAQNAGFGAMAGSMVISILLFLAIQGYLLATAGQTVGKKLLGLRIMRSSGERGEPVRVIGLRYLLIWVIAAIPVVGWIFALVDVLMIFRDSRKCLHDNIADTIVVKA
ncbi:MAG: RDD family protein [Burkholderiales bacterium]